MIPTTPHEAKTFARSLRAALEPHVAIGHGQSLDLLARALGRKDWNALAADLQSPSLGSPMPILRVFDSDLARRFYVGWLGFQVEFEHRFEPGFPLFTGISRDGTDLGLSEHYGDGTPGSVVWIPMRGLDAYRAELLADPARHQRPDIDHDAPAGPTMTVTDPFGNELRFCEPIPG